MRLPPRRLLLPAVLLLAAAASNSAAAGAASGDCCSDVATLRDRVQALEQRVDALATAAAAAAAGGSAGGAPAGRPSDGAAAEGFPDYYKLKEKAPERRYMDWQSFFYVSYEVYAGDRYLGEFRQSMPWVRLLWDEICFYDADGAFHGQLYFSAVKWLFVVPNPFVGTTYVKLLLGSGEVALTGAKESLIKSLFSAERRSLDFSWAPTGRLFKSRKTVELKRQQEWVIQAADGGKVAEIKESVVHDMWGRPFSGWTVSIIPGKADLVDPVVPGYFAAMDLAESADNQPMIFGTLLIAAATAVAVAVWSSARG